MFTCKHEGFILLVNRSSSNAHLLLIHMLLNSCGPVGSPVRERRGIMCLLLSKEGSDFPAILKALTDVGNFGGWVGVQGLPV